MATAAKSDLWVRILPAILLFAIAGVALWLGGIAYGLLLPVGGAHTPVAWPALVRPMPPGRGGRAGFHHPRPITVAGAIRGAWVVPRELGVRAEPSGIAIVWT